MPEAGDSSEENRLRASLMERGFAISTTPSASMAPTISLGDQLVLRPISTIRRGMIVVYARGPLLVIHRVIRVRGETVVCRGDALVRCDSPILAKDVIAQATEVVDGGPLADGYFEPEKALARACLTRLSRRVLHPWTEAMLLVRQLRHRAPKYGALSRGGMENSATDGAAVYVVGPADVLTLGAGALAASVSSNPRHTIIPAGIYSRLSADERQRLLAQVTGRRVDIWAYAIPRGSRVLRFTMGLRRFLRDLGLQAGEPGDAWLPPLDGLGPGFIHYFTQAELQREVESAGGTQVVVSVRGSGSLVRATALL